MNQNLIRTLPSAEEKSIAGGDGRDLRYKVAIAMVYFLAGLVFIN